MEADGLTVTGATPGGRVALFGVERRSKDFKLAIRRIREFSDATDAEGRTRFLFSKRPAIQTLWAAVDIDSGAFALATPEGMPLRRKNLQPAALGRDPTGRIIGIDIKADSLQVIVLRPRLGAFYITVHDGGPQDGDGTQNGSIRVAPIRMQPILGSVLLLPNLLAGDFVLAIDPLRMECIAVRMTD